MKLKIAKEAWRRLNSVVFNGEIKYEMFRLADVKRYKDEDDLLHTMIHQYLRQQEVKEAVHGPIFTKWLEIIKFKIGKQLEVSDEWCIERFAWPDNRTGEGLAPTEARREDEVKGVGGCSPPTPSGCSKDGSDI